MAETAIPAPPPSPVEELDLPEFRKAGVQLLLKRDDLLAPLPGGAFCGNKWRKLYYNLLAAREQGKHGLLSFGGAFSNHIAAVAEASRLYGFESVGIIRGEPTTPLNPTLKTAAGMGMQLKFVSRTAYRTKDQPDFLAQLGLKQAHYYCIPEGGSNLPAIRGCADLGAEIMHAYSPDLVAVACGTGGTLAGLACGIEQKCKVLNINILKGDWHSEIVRKWCEAYPCSTYSHFDVIIDYHHGGYAKWTPELIRFIRQFKTDTGIRLDPVYTGKLLFALSDMVQKGAFQRGTRLMAIHTGGLQGIAGFESRWGISLT